MSTALRARVRVVLGAVLVMTALAGCTTAVEPRIPQVSTPAPAVDPVRQYALDRLSTMTLAQKVRSMIMAHHPGPDAAAAGAFASANELGGIILMGDNMPGDAAALPASTTLLSRESALPVLIGIDQEGGIVRRIRSDEFAAADRLRSQGADAAREAFAGRSALLAGAGISVNFGVVADVTGDPASFIYDRTLGNTALEAAPRVAAAVEGENGLVLSTLKHFPGHGATPGDSHTSIPATSMSYETWLADVAPPFTAGIEAGADLVMTGHLRFDAVDSLPASLSPAWHDILRGELGFDGIIVTDDMSMLERSGVADYADQVTNAALAVQAGATMLLWVGPVDIDAVTAGIVSRVESGEIDPALIDDAALRLLQTRRTISGETGRFAHCSAECGAALD